MIEEEGELRELRLADHGLFAGEQLDVRVLRPVDRELLTDLMLGGCTLSLDLLRVCGAALVTIRANHGHFCMSCRELITWRGRRLAQKAAIAVAWCSTDPNALWGAFCDQCCNAAPISELESLALETLIYEVRASEAERRGCTFIATAGHA